MNICRVQNKDIVDITVCGITLLPDEIYTIRDNERQSWIDSDDVIDRIADGTLVIGNDISFFTTTIEQINWLTNKNTSQVEVTKSTPFANPEYKTASNASPLLMDVDPGKSAISDMIIDNEIYICGGEIVVWGAEMGDWVSASVVYGNYTLSTYIKKRWISHSGFMTFDTKPLIARLPKGVSLRITYNASPIGSKRTFGVNYDMAVKL